MKHKSSFAAILSVTTLLTACAGNGGNSLQTNSKVADDGRSSASILAPLSLNKRLGHSGSKPLFDPDSAFYADLPDCQSGPFHLKDLMVDEIRVSNQDLSTVSKSMSVMGYTVIDLQDLNSSSLARTYTCEELPIVVVQSRPEQLKVNFTDSGGNDSGAYSSGGMEQSGGNTVNPLGQSNAGELDSFLSYYHPTQKEKFNKLNWLVQRKLDLPSAQVYIETLVLEVREEDSEEFGIAFQEGRGDRLLSLGALSPGEGALGWIKDTFVDPTSGLQVFTPGIGKRVQIKALIDEGKAEVLSRPSVLAVSNRQAVIQIVDVIQTAELSSTLTESGNIQISSYQFSPLPIGITLNLKPRVSANRDWLTLEIDATVESEDDENSGQVFGSTETGQRVLLAEKQGSNSKKVRTFARIPDRTPIIIGGLVSKSIETLETKVPLLGSIPYLGKLFTTSDDEVQKREIIIVLTPYILDESGIGIGANQPDPSITGRLNDSLLFNNTYRIKNNDLFDVSALENNPQLIEYRNQLSYLAKVDPSLLTLPEVQSFMQETLPGAEHLLNKIIFDIVHQGDLSRHLNLGDIALFDKKQNSVTAYSMLDDADKFDHNNRIQLSRYEEKIIYQLKASNANVLSEDQSVMLKNMDDIQRLKSAIITADIIQLNGHYSGLKLDRLHPGMELKLPKYPTGKTITVSPSVLQIFEDSRHFYQSTQNALLTSFSTIDKFLQASN
jgi:general secretion pathway protein D